MPFSPPCAACWAAVSDIETAILKEDYAQARELAQRELSHKPQKAIAQKARYYLGLSHLKSGEYGKARASFQEIRKNGIDPYLRDKVFLGLFDAYYLEEEYKEAIDVAQEFLQQDPRTEAMSLTYLKLARVNLKLARWEDARDYLEKIIRSFPNSLESHSARQLLEEKQYFAVQIGAFTDRGKAEAFAAELKQKGEYAYIVETMDSSLGRRFYRVRVGQLALLKEAQKLKVKLAQLGYPAQIYP
jgi:tetratricopeptide (TPR) repeat protein